MTDKLTLERIAKYLQPDAIVKVPVKNGQTGVHAIGPQVFIEKHSRFVQFGTRDRKRLSKEELDIPAIPDLKICYENYNSVDYMIIGFNIRNGGLHEGSFV